MPKTNTHDQNTFPDPLDKKDYPPPLSTIECIICFIVVIIFTYLKVVSFQSGFSLSQTLFNVFEFDENPTSNHPSLKLCYRTHGSALGTYALYYNESYHNPVYCSKVTEIPAHACPCRFPIDGGQAVDYVVIGLSGIMLLSDTRDFLWRYGLHLKFIVQPRGEVATQNAAVG